MKGETNRRLHGIVEVRFLKVGGETSRRTPLPVEDDGSADDGHNIPLGVPRIKHVLGDLPAVQAQLEQHIARQSTHSPRESGIVPEEMVDTLAILVLASLKMRIRK